MNQQEPQMPPWLVQKTVDLWITTKLLKYSTRYGDVEIEPGFETDLFTGVPDTPFPEFWLASILHDYLLEMIRAGTPCGKITERSQCDKVFYDEMLLQGALIFLRFREEQGMKCATEVHLELIRISEWYYAGVTAYGWIWKLFHRNPQKAPALAQA